MHVLHPLQPTDEEQHPPPDEEQLPLDAEQQPPPEEEQHPPPEEEQHPPPDEEQFPLDAEQQPPPEEEHCPDAPLLAATRKSCPGQPSKVRPIHPAPAAFDALSVVAFPKKQYEFSSDG